MTEVQPITPVTPVAKKRKVPVLGIIVAVVVILAIWLIGMFNGMVRANESVDNKWSQVETSLQRRADLIPNLVNTVKGYASHEEGVFTEVANARAKLAGASTPAEATEANDALTAGLGRLLAISEAYPELKANESFIQLQDELAGTENRIATARKDYNDEVTTFNKSVKVFPQNIFAGMFGFSERDYFESAEGADKSPVVNFE